MQGLVWDGRDLAVHDDLEVRPPDPGEVAVRVRAAGLCHSDLKPLDGDISQPLPVVLGHEATGVVEACGPGVDLPAGQRVVLSVLRTCGSCAACAAGRPTLCRIGGDAGETPFSRGGAPVHQFVRLGAFAERTVVGARQVVPIQGGIPDASAALLGCAVITAFGAVEERAKVRPGESVLVVGAGGIGLNVVQAARIAGAARIAVADLNPRKEDIARELGATEFHLVPTAAELEALTGDIAPQGFDAVFECVGRPDLLAAAVEALAWGGRAVIVGLPPAGTPVTFGVRSLFHDQSLLGCRMGSVDPHTFVPRLVERHRSGELQLDPLVTKVVPLSEGPELVAALRAGELDRGVFGLDAGEGR
ncbi:alcohol dehydrogenase catalytic domain-containing protein [Actinomadura montaniterrae]|uniref:Alcohol dehydrogenase catalytic domain-containing protein n=1 Tax=Actinomadura montaniterrae TaxID=1803903 RepID=A0A6L3W1J0_9ACTN|nr:alcohol dehydrogenase catalytic domain-containing protein [Actinomadura montaniterrae]KAB2388711.1 alcohol dehydrogenase catalytic domain-containing protein [Actinomadura montaniterrae]